MPSENLQVDLRGRPITAARINRAMKISMVTASMGTIYFMLGMPASMVLTAFFRDSLGASNTQIGWLVGISRLCLVTGLFTTYLYDRVSSRKKVWIPATIIWRLWIFALAGLTLYVARGGSKQFVIYATMVLIGLALSMAYVVVPGWFGWFADLFPEKTRGQFIGRRHAFALLVSLPVYFGAMFLVHYLSSINPDYVYYAMAGVFMFAGVIGVVDIFLCMLIPEPRRTMPAGHTSLMQSLKNAMTPLKDLHFRSFLIAVCVVTFAGSIRGPFFGPFLRKTLGMPYYWLAIFGCLGILASLLTAKQWGFLGDRFGRRPVMAVSMFWGIFLLAYPYVDKDNCYYIVTTVNFLCVAVFTGYNVTVFQMCLSQAPEGKREACAGMWGAAIGVGGYLGAVLGGTLADWFESIDLSIPVWGGGEIGYMQAIIFISLGIQLCVGLPLVLRIREREHRTVTPLLSLLFGRNIFRLSANIGIAGGGYAPGRKVKALRTFKTRHDRIAQAEIEGNLDDPHPEVREEAVLALGRIGDAGAVETLLGLVRDKDAGLRRVAVRALGMIKDQRAVEPLLELLKEESEEIQEAAAEALGEIGGPASKSVLTDVLKSGRQVDRVLVKSAEAVSKFGDLAALWNIYPRMHETHNTVLRHQLAIAAGNLLGRPGEFYEILSKARASTNGVWTRMIRRSVKHVRRWAERSVGEQGLEQRMVNAKRREMVSVLNSLPTKVEDEDWASAIRDLRSVVRDLGLFVLGDLPGSDAEDIAFLAYPRYGIGVWFTTAVERRLEEADLDEGLLMIDCLLSLYFLSRFAPEVPMSQE